MGENDDGLGPDSEAVFNYVNEMLYGSGHEAVWPLNQYQDEKKAIDFLVTKIRDNFEGRDVRTFKKHWENLWSAVKEEYKSKNITDHISAKRKVGEVCGQFSAFCLTGGPDSEYCETYFNGQYERLCTVAADMEVAGNLVDSFLDFEDDKEELLGDAIIKRGDQSRLGIAALGAVTKQLTEEERMPLGGLLGICARITKGVVHRRIDRALARAGLEQEFEPETSLFTHALLQQTNFVSEHRL